MPVTADQYMRAAREHLEDYFAGHDYSVIEITEGPALRAFSRLQIVVVQPGPRTDFVTYASIGGGVVLGQDVPGRMEFIVLSIEPIDRAPAKIAEMLLYHAGNTLGLGHTIPLGYQWVEGSALDHCLITRPYVLPDLEILVVDESVHSHFLWMLPITEAERGYKITRGFDALEELFEYVDLEYWDPRRKCAVVT